jgi:ABC-type multidrug transport system permease subunit
LAPERWAEVEAAIRAKLAEQNRIAEEPLSGVMRLLIVFGVCATFWLPLYYKANGYRRKAKESWRWLGYTYLFYFGLAALTVIIRKLASP